MDERIEVSVLFDLVQAVLGKFGRTEGPISQRLAERGDVWIDREGVRHLIQ